MLRIITLLRSGLLYSTTVLLVALYPMSAYAEDATPPSTTTTPAPSQPTETSTPPATQPPAPSTTTTPPTSSPSTTTPTTTPPSPPKTYTYDAATGRWNSDEWTYDAASNTYKPTPKPAAAPITLATPSNDPAAAKVTTDLTSNSAVNANTANNIANALDALSKTGNAGVVGNTTGGSATSGNAAATATIVNNLNSTITNSSNKEAATFVSDVMGDVNGDILLQPMLLKAMLEANITANHTANLNNSTDITNNINLASQSGNATVASNTKAGNATSGAANTVVDVVNVVNSMIAANQSFIGTINIYGNLNGDILIAPDFLAQMMANNGNTSATHTTNTSQVVNVDNTTDIVNNVALAAKSGEAAVLGNTKAGNATSGAADTNVVIFNMTGHEIVAKDSLLVFINVLGKWVGVIVDAPVGATAAAIGNGVSSSSKTDASLVIDAANETRLTNNINLASQSGDALVAENTLGGNATSGNATASANIANIANTSVNLSGWFGVLFINVFGTWHGSFGVDTLAGTRVRQAQSSTNSTKSGQPLRVVSFIARDAAENLNSTLVTPTTVIEPAAKATTVAASQPVAQDVLAQVSDIPQHAATAAKRAMNIPVMIGSLVLVAGSLWGLRRFLF